MGNNDFKKAVWFYPRFMGFNPSERWGHSACYSNGFLYIFGGCCGGLHFSDVLVLNLETMSWTNLATTGVGPGPRDSHSAVIVRHMMIVFGGTNGSKKVNDIHILDLLTHEWTQPNCKGVVPTPRESHTATMVGHDRLVIFGGSGEGDANYLNDLHILDLKTMKWTSPEPKGDVPMPRDSHIAVSIDNKIFIYGGDCGDRYRGDVDVFNVNTLTWSRFLVQGPSPGVRAGHAAVIIGTKAVVGGWGYTHRIVPYDAYRGRCLNFFKFLPTGVGGLYDAYRPIRRVYMIGGVGDKQYYNDVWMLDTISCSWMQLDVRGRQPQGRFSHTAIVVDSEIAIYGGCGEDERPLNELLILQLGSDNPNNGYDKMFSEKRQFLHTAFCSDSMHMRRRRKLNSKACESEAEEHSLSLSQHSSPSHSDQERNIPEVLPLFKNHNQISSSCKKTPGATQSNPIMIPSRTLHGPNFIHATQAEPRNIGVQNLIGAEVHGKVDGVFDSGYMMTATVNGRIFRGVLFPPGPEVVSGRGNNRRSHTNRVAFITHSPSEAIHRQDPHLHRPPSVIRSVPALSLGREQPNEPRVVLTLGSGMV